MNDYELLWESRGRFSEDELLQKIEAARKKERKVVEKPFLPYDEALIKTCQAEVLRSRNIQHSDRK
jgi:hypothetical protein